MGGQRTRIERGPGCVPTSSPSSDDPCPSFAYAHIIYMAISASSVVANLGLFAVVDPHLDEIPFLLDWVSRELGPHRGSRIEGYCLIRE